MKTPRQHLADQYEAIGRPIEARRVRAGRLSSGEMIALRAIEAAGLEALATRVRRGPKDGGEAW